MKHKRGFTLIELLITITIVAILAVMVVPRFIDTITYMRLKTTTQLICAQMRMLQEFSISESNSYRTTFLTNNDQVRFYARAGDDSEIRELRIYLPPGVTFTNANSLDLHFGTNGGIRTYARAVQHQVGGSVRVRSSSGKVIYIIWNSSGRIRLSKTSPPTNKWHR